MAQEEYDFDPWETSTGLFDKITVRFDNPHFGFDAQINDGQTCLFIPEGTILSGEGIDEPTEFNQFFGCGPGWEPASKGARVVREDGKAKKFNANTAYALLFTSLLKCAIDQGVENELRKRGTPFDASTWQGLVAYMERVEQPSFKGRDGEEVKRSVLLVRKIDQIGDTKAPATNSTAAKEAPTGESDGAHSTTGATADGLDPKLKAQLRALARECADSNQFVERGFDLAGVLGNAEAEQAIMDGSIWQSVQSS